ncbi:MAG: cytochrome c biogenesis protein CcdA [Verrucomicrobiaceae bacterium]
MRALLFLAIGLGLTHADVDPFDDKYAVPPGEAVVEEMPAEDPFSANFEKSEERDYTIASVVSEVKAFKPGEPFWVALKLDHPKEWHSYYLNPGATGNAPDVKWELPEGWSAGELVFPIPHVTPFLTETTYAYEGVNYFLTEISPPAEVALGTEVEIKGSAAWQICKEVCVQEPGLMSRFPMSVTVVAAELPEASDLYEEIELALGQTAKESEAWELVVKDAGSNYYFELTPGAMAVEDPEGVYFFAEQKYVTDEKGEQKLEKTESGYRLVVPKYKGEEENEGFELKDLRGILAAESGWEQERDVEALVVANVAVGEADRSDLYEQVSVGALLGTFGALFVGGLILNLMPCVFPVIGLKIMGFVNQAGEDKKKIVVHGLMFVLGVLVSFWVIAGILLVLREAALDGGGEAVGWGYQLQNPYMVWALLLIMLVLGLSMFGLFEIGVSATSVGSGLQSKSGLAGTFFSGVLATVVATPCSAPFLGPAIGLAVKLPPVEFMMAFTAMALGLGAPYLVLSIFPNLVKKLPRPGAWMESFKQGMSFLLFGTAGFLLWVYMDLNDSFHGLSIVIGLTLIATAAWVYGRWFAPHRVPRTRKIGLGIALVLLAGGLYASRPVAEDGLKWGEWSEQAVADALDEGQPVFVDFTAKWCLTCQVNKKTAYTDEVKKAFKERKVLLLRADKTKPSPDIEAALAKLDRTAIPVNALYVPGKDEPTITPEVLTPGYLLELLEKEVPVPE